MSTVAMVVAKWLVVAAAGTTLPLPQTYKESIVSHWSTR